MRLGSTRLMRALLYAELVWNPACHPSSETTGKPSFSIAMASRAADICSPALSSISISRREASALISFAFAIRSSVVSPWAETTTTTLFPFAYVFVTMSAT